MTKTRQRILAVLSCAAHLILGFSILLHYGPVGSSAAWDVLAVYSRVISPSLFILIGILAAVGLCKPRVLQASLYTGMIVMEIWAIALGLAWVLGYGPQPSLVWIAFVGYLKWVLASVIADVNRVNIGLARTLLKNERRLEERDASIAC